jgi:CHAT domain-containing protein
MSDKLQSSPWSIVHIATHGEFGSTSEQSYLRAWDGRLSIDRLQESIGLFRYREHPLELLVLSACDTATGDARSALGLSGVAIKAGALSAIGTLWRVNDRATSLLIQHFYDALSEDDTSRAEALRKAQVSLMSDRRYWHPGYWSPFLLINSWL